MGKVAGDLLITLFGALTSLITAVLLLAIQHWTGFSVHGFTLSLIIPLGAIFAGIAAAQGYFWGSRWLGHRPTRLLLVNILLVAAGTFFLVHYLSYMRLAIDGLPVRNYIAFPSYLNLVLTQTSLTIRGEDLDEMRTIRTLGGWGYLYALLQVLGFAVGGLIVYAHLKDLPYCGTCHKYLIRGARAYRYSDKPDLLLPVLQNITPLLSAGQLSAAVSLFREFGVAKADGMVRIELAHWHCRQCSENRLCLFVATWNGENWNTEDVKFEGISASAFTLEVSAA
jgi:hypothetical protein